MEQQLAELKKAIQTEDKEKVEEIFTSILSGGAGGGEKDRILREVRLGLDIIQLEILEECLEILKEIEVSEKDTERRLQAIGALKD